MPLVWLITQTPLCPPYPGPILGTPETGLNLLGWRPIHKQCLNQYRKKAKDLWFEVAWTNKGTSHWKRTALFKTYTCMYKLKKKFWVYKQHQQKSSKHNTNGSHQLSLPRLYGYKDNDIYLHKQIKGFSSICNLSTIWSNYYTWS